MSVAKMASEEYVDRKVGAKYTKPGNGIPASDMTSEVQSSLGKADTALQQHQDISHKADKDTTYTKTEVDEKLQAVKNGSRVVVQELPESGDPMVIYMVPKSASQTNNSYDEYIWTSTGEWEKIGDTETDLSDYYNKDAVNALLNGKQDALTFDNAPTSGSNNPVKSGGIWSAIWGALAALPTGFTSLYDWVVAQLAGKLDASSAAPTFAAKTYAANDLCTYNGVVYRCKVGYTATASSAKPDADTTHWEAKPVSDLFLPLSGGVMDGSITFGNIEIYPFGNKLVFHGLSGDYEVQLSVDKDTDIALLSNIASDFSNSATYALNELCVYNRVLYRCTTAITTAEYWTPAHWTEATVEDVLAALRTAVAGKADASAIPYTLGTATVIDTASSEVVEGETVNFGAATLANRTANIVQVTAATALDELRITFPAATSGKVRDFGLRVEIGTGSAALAAPALVPIAPTGETIKLENADGTIPELADGTATAKGVTLLYFSETAPGVFVVKGEQVEEVA